MLLRDVLAEATGAAADVPISGLAYDDRRAGPGVAFFCVRGLTRDGHDFAATAAANGAAALVVDHVVDVDLPQVVVPDVRAAMAPAAAALAGDPTASLAMVGVTGTNGKTTTAFLTRALLEAGGLRTGMLGTVEQVIDGRAEPAVRTTPEAIDLQPAFAAMRDAGDVACVIEVSSHALALHRADAIHWDVAIFTNLTQDHLDFHPSMEEYFAAKRRLFDAGPRLAVINIDDAYGRRLAAEIPAALTIAIDDPEASLRATEVVGGFAGSRFVAGGLELEVALPGRFNVLNALGAVAAARTLGVADEQIVAALPAAGRVPGRFEPVDAGQDFAVIVDYAHTPDSLDNVLRAARELTDGRVLVVFGCGGDRDRGKRPLMGAIAGRLADVAYVTSDNPRSEAPDAIIAEILGGVGSGMTVESIEDRAEAIAGAVASARAGDVVVIAGKGHEQGQEFADGVTLPFDDMDVARAALTPVRG